MTHPTLLSFIPLIIQTLLIFGFIVFLPAIGAATVARERGRQYFAGAIGLAGLLSWLAVSHIMALHGRLQEDLAKKAGCMGYAETELPERCVTVMSSARAIPDGFFAISFVALGIGIISLLVVVLHDRGETDGA